MHGVIGVGKQLLMLSSQEDMRTYVCHPHKISFFALSNFFLWKLDPIPENINMTITTITK